VELTTDNHNQLSAKFPKTTESTPFHHCMHLIAHLFTPNSTPFHDRIYLTLSTLTTVLLHPIDIMALHKCVFMFISLCYEYTNRTFRFWFLFNQPIFPELLQVRPVCKSELEQDFFTHQTPFISRKQQHQTLKKQIFQHSDSIMKFTYS